VVELLVDETNGTVSWTGLGSSIPQMSNRAGGNIWRLLALVFYAVPANLKISLSWPFSLAAVSVICYLWLKRYGPV